MICCQILMLSCDGCGWYSHRRVTCCRVWGFQQLVWILRLSSSVISDKYWSQRYNLVWLNDIKSSVEMVLSFAAFSMRHTLLMRCGCCSTTLSNNSILPLLLRRKSWIDVHKSRSRCQIFCSGCSRMGLSRPEISCSHQYVISSKMPWRVSARLCLLRRSYSILNTNSFLSI